MYLLFRLLRSTRAIKIVKNWNCYSNNLYGWFVSFFYFFYFFWKWTRNVGIQKRYVRVCLKNITTVIFFLKRYRFPKVRHKHIWYKARFFLMKISILTHICYENSSSRKISSSLVTCTRHTIFRMTYGIRKKKERKKMRQCDTHAHGNCRQIARFIYSGVGNNIDFTIYYIEYGRIEHYVLIENGGIRSELLTLPSIESHKTPSK